MSASATHDDAPLLAMKIKRKPLSTAQSYQYSSDIYDSPTSLNSPSALSNVAGAARLDNLGKTPHIFSSSSKNPNDLAESKKTELGSENVQIPPKGWPEGPLSLSSMDFSRTFEIAVYIVLALGAMWFVGQSPSILSNLYSQNIDAACFLVQAALSASVHNTFLQDKRKYIAGEPIIKIEPVVVSHNNVYSIKNRPTALNVRMLEVSKLGPTIFPMLFAGIIASMLRLIARWKVEKGSKLEVSYLRNQGKLTNHVFATRFWSF